jgi:hypothetical protein
MPKRNPQLIQTEQVRQEAHALEKRYRALAERGDGADFGELRRGLDSVMRRAELMILATARIQGTPVLTVTNWGAKLRQMREDMGHESAPEVERALIEHISICWLRLALAEISLTTATEQAEDAATVERYDRRLSAAQKRFTRAVETLAKVRRLASRAPLFQVNIGATET